MRKLLIFLIVAVLLSSCKNDLTFEEKTWEHKTSLPCKDDCAHISISIPVAANKPVVADSINAKIFATMKEIIYVGEDPYPSSDYEALTRDFIASYEKMQKEAPEEKIGWEGNVTGKIIYETDSILNIEIQHYTYTGGAHGYSGKRSLIFDPSTGKAIHDDFLFKDKNAFKKFAEKKFRQAYKLEENQRINESGLMFEDDLFHLPQTFFFTEKGFLLYYNVYEIASYADGPKQLLIPYSEMQPYLAVR